MRARRRRAWVVVLPALVACSVAELDLSGKRCPCSSGYVCDGARNVCVPSLGDAGGLDSGVLDGPQAGETGMDARGSGDGADGQGTPETSPPSDCDASLATDPLNCGRCGHDCLGGTCQAGACQPVALALVSGGRGAVAVDDVNVYFPTPAPTSGVAACAKTGCNNMPTTIITDPGTVSSPGLSIATDGTNVYWANSTDVMQCAVGGCNGQALHLATNQSFPHAVVVDSTNVYWLTLGSVSGGNVVKCAIGGAGGPTTVATDALVPEGVAVDATTIYWTDDDTAGVGQVQTCPLSGCMGAPSVLASNQTFPATITLDANNVYWLNVAGSPAVVRCAKGGCGNAPTPLATSLTQPGGLVVDPNSLFVSVASGAGNQMGQILVCPVGGCNNTYSVLAHDASRTTAIAADVTAIYWIDTAGGIWRVAK